MSKNLQSLRRLLSTLGEAKTPEDLSLALGSALLLITKELKALGEDTSKVDEVRKQFEETFAKIELKKGDVGEKGKDGIGERGEKGEKGERGLQGLKGEKGEQGSKGEQGERGERGEQGIQGEKGADGTEVSPEQIRNKLELLQGNERLDKKAIQGLDEEFEKLNERITNIPRGGRLGMRKIPIPRTVDLSDQCNGVLKSFSLPTDTTRVYFVIGSQFPQVHSDIYADWTFTGNTLTLGAGVGAPKTGQRLLAFTEALFY